VESGNDSNILANLSDGDVEYIPAVDLCIEILMQKESELLASIPPVPVDHWTEDDISTDHSTPATEPQLVSGNSLLPSSAGKVNRRDRSGSADSAVSNTFQPSNTSSNIQHFFQSIDGSAVFLHPLCARCLLESASLTNSPLPETLSGIVLEAERVQVTEESRKRLTLLRHLPLHSEVWLVEVDLSQLAPPEVLEKFQNELSKRADKRMQQKVRRVLFRKDINMWFKTHILIFFIQN